MALNQTQVSLNRPVNHRTLEKPHSEFNLQSDQSNQRAEEVRGTSSAFDSGVCMCMYSTSVWRFISVVAASESGGISKTIYSRHIYGPLS